MKKNSMTNSIVKYFVRGLIFTVIITVFAVFMNIVGLGAIATSLASIFVTGPIGLLLALASIGIMLLMLPVELIFLGWVTTIVSHGKKKGWLNYALRGLLITFLNFIVFMAITLVTGISTLADVVTGVIVRGDIGAVILLVGTGLIAILSLLVMVVAQGWAVTKTVEWV